MVRDAPHYRADAFRSGLKHCGFEVCVRIADPDPGDLVLVWNRYGETHHEGRRFEKAGARVLVAENGYCGRDWRGGIWYAIAHNWHNGRGSWFVGGPERAHAQFDEPEPWAPGTGPVLVLGQRGIGAEPVVAPNGWFAGVLRSLQANGVPVVFRDHPGRDPDTDGLARALYGARAAVTWTSSAGLRAILAGVPCYHGLPQWIAAPAAVPFATPLPPPFLGDRWPMLERLAWAHWELSEIASGVAFDYLLCGPAQKL